MKDLMKEITEAVEMRDYLTEARESYLFKDGDRPSIKLIVNDQELELNITEDMYIACDMLADVIDSCLSLLKQEVEE